MVTKTVQRPDTLKPGDGSGSEQDQPAQSIFQMVQDKQITGVGSIENLLVQLNTDLCLLRENPALTSSSPLEWSSNSDSEFDVPFAASSLESLPKETLLFILSYLDLKSLMNLSQVCHFFRESVQDPKLYTKLCLKSIFQLVSDQCLATFSTRCSFLAHLDLSWCGNYGKLTPSALVKFFEACGSNLVTLRLGNCHSCNEAVIRQISLSLSLIHI